MHVISYYTVPLTYIYCNFTFVHCGSHLYLAGNVSVVTVSKVYHHHHRHVILIFHKPLK